MKLLYGFIAIMLLSTFLVGADEQKAYVVLLHYDLDGFTVKHVEVKNGYAPDRKLQQGNFRAELLSAENKVMYGFNFEVPLLIFTDTTQAGAVRGSVIKLTETDFVLVVPFYEQASIRIRDGENEYIAPLSPETFGRRLIKMGLWSAAGGVLFISFLLVRKRFNEKEPPNTGRVENLYQMPPGQY